MSKYRDLNKGDVLPASFLDAMQEFISTMATSNWHLVEHSSTAIRVEHGDDNDQVGIGINGRWRYNNNTNVPAGYVEATHPGGSAGTYGVWVTGSDNNFAVDDVDDTVYNFGLVITASTPGTVLKRKVGTVDWDGSAITAVDQFVFLTTGRHAAKHEPGGSDAIDYTLVHLVGPNSSKPAAGPTNAGLLYLSTDVHGGTLYRSNGTTWVQTARGVTEDFAHAATHAPGAGDALDYTLVHLHGLFADMPAAAAGNAGLTYLATDEDGGTTYLSTGSTWLQTGRGVNKLQTISKTFQTSHNYAVQGAIGVPLSDLNYFPPFRVALGGAQTAKLARVEYRLNNGAVATSVTFDVKLNGTAPTGFGSLTAGGTHGASWHETDPADVVLADRDELVPVVTAVTGAPENLSVTIVLEHTI